MDLSIFLARVFGLYLTVAGVSFFLRRKDIDETIAYLAKSPGLTYFIGLMALLLGLLVVVSHNVWDGSWRTIITILGWLGLLKGLVRTLFPHSVFVGMVQAFMKKGVYPVFAVVSVVLGLYLAAKGFGLA